MKMVALVYILTVFYYYNFLAKYCFYIYYDQQGGLRILLFCRNSLEIVKINICVFTSLFSTRRNFLFSKGLLPVTNVIYLLYLLIQGFG